MSFADPDGGDTHAVAFTPEGPGYLGTFILTGLDDTTGSIGWTFSVSDSAVNYLKAGQSLTQKYDVTVDDSHGGTAMQTVTVTLIGTDDAKNRRGAWKGRSVSDSLSPTTAPIVFFHEMGKGAVSDVAFTDNGADLLFFHEMQRDQAPAPEPLNTHASICPTWRSWASRTITLCEAGLSWILLFELPDSARHWTTKWANGRRSRNGPTTGADHDRDPPAHF